MKRFLPLCILLLGAGLWWVLASGPEPRASVGSPSVIDGAGAEGGAADAGHSFAGSSEPISTAASSTPADQRTTLPDDPDRPLLEYQVQVLDGLSKQPYLPEELLFLEMSEEQTEDWISESWSGLATVSDEDLAHCQRIPGQDRSAFTVRTHEPRALVHVRTETHSGLHWLLASGPRDAVLEVFPRRGLTIRLLDAAGAPVPDWSVEFAPDEFGASWGSAHATTDADGLASFAELGQEFLRAAHRGEPGWVLAGLGGAMERGTAVPLDPWPSETVDIRLPAAGGLVLRLVDGAGLEGRATASRIGGPERGWSRGYHFAQAEIVDGVARFDRLALGLDFELRAWVEGWGGDGSIPVKGPSQPGESPEAWLDLAAGPSLRGRLVDPEGAPVADTDCAFSNTPNRRYGSFRTDADGRFHILLSETVAQEERLYLLPHREDRDHRNDLSRIAVLELGGELPPGWHELGDVLLESTPTVVAGQVVDEAGDPVDGAWLRVEQPRPGSGDRWDEAAGVDGVSVDAEGRFRIQGLLTREAPTRLKVYADGWLPVEPLPITPGAEDLRIQLRQGAFAEARLELPEGFGCWDFALYLHSAGPDEGGVRLRQEDGLWTSRPAEAGEYRLVVRLEDEREPLLEVPGIRLLPGETTRDPRAWPIDLRPLLRQLVIRVLDADGEPIEQHAQFGLPIPPGTKLGWSRPYFLRSDRLDDQRYRLRCAASRGEGIAVAAQGYWAGFLDSPRDGAEVRLQPEGRLSLDWGRALDPGPDGQQLALQLNLEGGDALDPRFAGISSGPRVLGAVMGASRAEVAVAQPGHYEVWWRVYRQEEGEHREWLVAKQGDPIAIDGSKLGGVIPVTIPAAVLAALAGDPAEEEAVEEPGGTR